VLRCAEPLPPVAKQALYLKSIRVHTIPSAISKPAELFFKLRNQLPGGQVVEFFSKQ
jgi:hypothetical protein